MIDLIDLEGTAFERGRAFGAARRRHIEACLSDWLGSLKKADVSDPVSHLSRMLQSTNFLPAIREHTPDLLDEVRGIAAGANQPLELMLAEQLMDEEWAFRASIQSDSSASGKCSSAAIHAGNGLTWIGQNMDLGGYTDGHQAVLRIAPHGPEQGTLIFTIGGMIGLMGINARGVGVCVNSLPQLRAATEGLPVAFVIRKLLQAESAEHAAQVVRAIPHATGQHYLIADPDRVRSFEACAEGVLEYHPIDVNRVVHTNHPLTEHAGAAEAPRSRTNTEARLRSLTQRLMTGQPDLAALKAALSASDDPHNPVCRVPNPDAEANRVTGIIGFTTGSMVSSLQRSSSWLKSWVSNGPPCLRGYEEIGLSVRHPGLLRNQP